MNIATIGLDLAKHWFQVHGIDERGQAVVRRKLRRSEVIPYFRALPPCLVGMEACATAHHWAHELAALGHQVKLMPPGYVKAYVKHSKNDAADAEAICEALTRPSMRFVPVKTAEQQAVLMLHRARNLLVRQRTILVNALRAHMAEFGIIAPQGLLPMPALLPARPCQSARGRRTPRRATRPRDPPASRRCSRHGRTVSAETEERVAAHL